MENRPPSNANVRTRGSRATKTAAESTSAKRRLTPEQRAAMGKAARAQAPLQAHAEFQPQEVRDPVALLLSQAETRVPDLVPIRHGRMLVSPFTFYRGAALVMAADLRETPTSGLQSQLCAVVNLPIACKLSRVRAFASALSVASSRAFRFFNVRALSVAL
jgi:Uncharacterized protein conserved in bacteria (DUF2252)